jgi:predicted nucleotidyltransferase
MALRLPKRNTPHASQIHHDLQRLMPELELKYGVLRLGYFTEFTSKNVKPTRELNVIVELRQPLGWAFFEMKEFLERRLQIRLDVITPKGIKVIFKDKVLQQVKWI